MSQSFFYIDGRKNKRVLCACTRRTYRDTYLSLSPPFLTFHSLTGSLFTFYFFFSFSLSSSQDERKASISDEEEKAEEVKQERLIYFYGPNDDLERGRCTAAAFNDSGKLGGKTFCFLFFLSHYLSTISLEVVVEQRQNYLLAVSVCV